MSDLKEEIHLINRYEIETVDQDNNKKRYIYDEEQNKVKIKDILLINIRLSFVTSLLKSFSIIIV